MYLIILEISPGEIFAVKFRCETEGKTREGSPR
jgi:hypothetical protein